MNIETGFIVKVKGSPEQQTVLWRDDNYVLLSGSPPSLVDRTQIDEVILHKPLWDLHLIAKTASEAVNRNSGCAPQLAYAPILLTLQDAMEGKFQPNEGFGPTAYEEDDGELVRIGYWDEHVYQDGYGLWAKEVDGKYLIWNGDYADVLCPDDGLDLMPEGTTHFVWIKHE